MIVVRSSDDAEVSAFRMAIQQEPGSALAGVILFGGDRWRNVERVALLKDDGQIVGMASLAPHGENGQGGPHIIGIWVSGPYRSRGHGMALLKALAHESLARYGQSPTIEANTIAGDALCRAAERERVSVRVLPSFPLPLDL